MIWLKQDEDMLYYKYFNGYIFEHGQTFYII